MVLWTGDSEYIDRNHVAVVSVFREKLVGHFTICVYEH